MDTVLDKGAECLFVFVRYIARGRQNGKDKKPGFGPVFFRDGIRAVARDEMCVVRNHCCRLTSLDSNYIDRVHE
jgi:hypothetical protein